ncbi:MAG: hypothetical protein K2Q22_17530, partial [Cytophagales bacterium]|nr:hypothetical protein [Cytophagales bacterium]
KYNFNVTQPVVEADIVSLSFPSKLDSTIKGSFQYKSVKRAPNAKAKYPRFKSFSNNISVKGIGKDIIYKGGFSLEGKRITSSSYSEGKCTIESKGKFIAISSEFEFRDSIIYSQIASVLILIEKDSLMHAGISFNYNPGKKEVKLIKDEGSFKNAPFRDTYHKLEIESDMLRYDLAKNVIDMQILNGRSQIPAKFSSFEFYDPEKYSQLQGILRFHPLQMVIGFARTKKSSQFYLDDLAKENKLNPQTVKSAMTELMKLGYIDFLPSSGFIKIRPKAYHYIVSKSGKKDFDNISVESVSESKPNCSLDMKSKELLVRGFRRFYLSDSMGVYVDPDSTGEIRFL